jgi:anti-sigma regulatory factor (Ser/Thr protein kinase)/N-acetylglutamate synthase-like GNAT family acetyltransferase
VSKEVWPSKLIFRVELPSTADSVNIAGGCVAHAARAAGFSTREVTTLRLATEEAVNNAVEHAYPQQDTLGTIHVSAERHGSGLKVLVRDWGLPIYELAPSGSHGLHLMQELTNQVSLHNLGRGGKEVEIIKLLSPKHSPTNIDDEDEQGEIEVRDMTKVDAPQVCQCFYAGYGYTYGYGDLYYPERLIELETSGHLKSVVAVTPKGRVVGHSALVLENPDDCWGELAMAIVHPNYRGHHLFDRMFTMLTEKARAMKLESLFAHAVSIHPISQHVLHKLGMKDTAILLGYAPPSKISEEAGAHQRQSFVVEALILNTEVKRPKLYPARHRSMVEWLLKDFSYEPVYMETAGDVPEHTLMSGTVSAGLNVGTLTFRQVGRDASQLASAALRRMCIQRVDVVQLYVSLSEPGLLELLPTLEKLGFFFAGLHPGWCGGVALIMQYLNNLEVDPTTITFEWKETQKLLDYVMACQAESLLV